MDESKDDSTDASKDDTARAPAPKRKREDEPHTKDARPRASPSDIGYVGIRLQSEAVKNRLEALTMAIMNKHTTDVFHELASGFGIPKPHITVMYDCAPDESAVMEAVNACMASVDMGASFGKVHTGHIAPVLLLTLKSDGLINLFNALYDCASTNPKGKDSQHSLFKHACDGDGGLNRHGYVAHITLMSWPKGTDLNRVAAAFKDLDTIDETLLRALDGPLFTADDVYFKTFEA